MNREEDHRMTETDPDNDFVHQSIDVCPFELGLSTIHHQLRFSSSEQHESIAPPSIPQHAASQQNLVIIQSVRLFVPRQRSVELVQVVVRCLANNFACKETKQESHQLVGRQNAAALEFDPKPSEASFSAVFRCSFRP